MEQTQSESIGKLAEALCAVQRDIKGAIKDATNPFFKSNYADLESVWACCRELLTANSLCVIQTNGGTSEAPSVITTLAHTSGEWIRGELALSPLKKGPQDIGSCITYGRRYGLAAIIGIIQVDDDGEGATDRKKKAAPPAKTPAPVKSENKDPSDPSLISEAQRKRLFAIGKGNDWPDADIKILIGRHGFESSGAITKVEYPKIIEQLEKKFSDI